MDSLKKKYSAPALDKGLDILELLAHSSVGLTQAEIAKGLNRVPNEVYRMLTTLLDRNYICGNATGDRYSLSLKLLSLANLHPPRRRLLEIAEPLMKQASRQSEQSCQLAVWENGRVIINASVPAFGNWQFSIRVGASLGLYNTASGLILAAFQSDGLRKQMIADCQLVSGETAIEDKEFSKLLDDIKHQGFYQGASDAIFGAVNLSFPILDRSGTAIAAITCPYIKRIDINAAPQIDEVIGIFKETCAKIILQLNGKIVR
ncbi:MAG: IclR family transcriptional regulator [Hyphomicrobiales bacterium]|nr:IclR family transcriptional regulator [Hyphomicrobiales bacterium]